ncbi:MAG: D-alanyl-D-alanine carboxypeptidase/D-alanyl-D-alanine-endopeptidase [Bacteroidetes bacterium]|nr:D-alanyl-D-alanine carboxypeptidase/D-alanyl-D-alanine-endopeptidase [Bacteroidota bacterium]
MLRKNFVIIFLLASSFVLSQTPNQISDKLKSFQQTETLKHAQFSVSAKYVESGEVIISYYGEKSLAPASNLKLFTTAAALEILGQNYKYETKLYYDGEIDNNGTLKGNIILSGGGDPTLGSKNFEDNPQMDSLLTLFVNAITQKGIKKINGSVIADNSRYDNVTIPGTWNWVDIGNYYGAQTSGLALNDNLYYIFFKPGKNVDDPAEVIKTEPEIPELIFVNNMKTGPAGSGDNGYIYNGPNSFEAELRGTIPQGFNEFSIKGSVPNPALLAAQLLNSSLNNSGILTNGKPNAVTESLDNYDESNLMMVISSPPLKDIVKIINKKSFNFYADMILKELGYKVYNEGSFNKGIKAVEDFFKKNGIDDGGLNIYDGSGLSRANMITANMMTDLLLHMTKTESYESFFNSLPVAGDTNDSGTLKNFGRNTVIEKKVFAKTGSIGGVRAHSGYIKSLSGKLIAFSIITNNYSGGSSGVNEIHKQVMIELAKMK